MTRRVLAGRRGLLIAAALAVAALVLGAAWTAHTVNSAQSLRDDLQKLDDVRPQDLADADSEELGQTLASLQDTQPRAQDLRRDAAPYRVAASALSWAPMIGDNLEAAVGMVDRAALDVDASIALLQAAMDLRQAFVAAEQSLQDAAASPAASEAIIEQIDAASGHVRRADAMLSDAAEIASRTDADSVNGSLRGELGTLARHEQRLQDFVAWAGPAADAARRMAELADTAGPMLALFQEGGLARADRFDQLDEDLRRVERISEEARQAAAEANGRAPSEVSGSSAGKRLQALEVSLQAMQLAAEGGLIGLEASRPALELFENSDRGILEDGERNLRAMELMAERQDEMAAAAEKLDEAVLLLDRASATGAGGGEAALSELAGFIVSLRGGIALGRDLPAVAPELLGAEEPKTYLVLGQTSDELRATGGFVSSVWEMTFFKGALVETEYRDVVDVDDLDNLALYPEPPDALQEHMNASVWLMRDVTWKPDFPVTARLAQELYRLGQGREVDGVAAITPWAFTKLINVLGPVNVDGREVSPGELMAVVEEGTDREGRGYLQKVFDGLLQALDNPAARSGALRIAGALHESLEEKQALIYVDDPATQKIISEKGWAGEMPIPDHDRLYVVDSNVGWSKVDRNIDRGVDYSVQLRRGGPSLARLTLTYQNTSEPGDDCDQQFKDRGAAYDVLKNACYWNLLRAYVADGSELVSADEFPLPRGSIYVQAGRGAAGQDSFSARRDSNGTNWRGLMTVAPGATRSLSFVYELPEGVVNWEDEPEYTLDLVRQPGTLGRRVSVEVAFPEGYEFEGASVPPSRVGGGAAAFDLRLREDTTLNVRLRRAG